MPITGGYEWRQPSLVLSPLVRQVFRGNKVADESRTTSILVHHVYIKLGGVPDKLRVFPADES